MASFYVRDFQTARHWFNLAPSMFKTGAYKQNKKEENLKPELQ